LIGEYSITPNHLLVENMGVKDMFEELGRKFSSFFYTVEGGPNWYLILLIIAWTAFFGGFYFVSFLRYQCKSSKQATRLTVAVFAIPILLFVVNNIIAYFGMVEKMVTDAISFGTVAGILIQLSLEPTGKGNVKLLAHQANGKTTEVWLDGVESNVGEVRQQIADALDIHQVGRICIESVKGNFIEDSNQIFSALVDDSLRTMDFFGFITLSCYIFVKEEEPTKKRVTILEDPDRENKRTNPFLAILQKQVKYGDQMQLAAKIAAAVESRAYFTIARVDKFVAAAPSTMLLISQTSLRLHAWCDDSEVAIKDGASDNGDNVSVTSTPNKVSNKKSLLMKLRPRKKEENMGKSVCNGDTVVLESGGKFMSISRGWWLAWSSTEPRRSGAFTVEIIEKAQSRLKEQFDKIKENISLSSTKEPSQLQQGPMDNILRPGDMFRLRSVKFPDFELGLTSVKVRDEYCYLGLRKMNEENMDTGHDDTWAMEVRFVFRG
jgi:hypothetical protein